MNALRQWLLAFRPSLLQANRNERIRATIGALIGVFVTGITSYWLVGNSPELPMLVAPIGASAVLLFAIPSGPLSQPWSIVCGNILSAAVGVTALMLFDTLAVQAALAVSGAIAVMFLTRSLHPPGGAMALATVLGGDAVLSQGYYWALAPVGFESVLLVCTGLLYHNLTGRRYPPLPVPPPPLRATDDPRPTERLGFTQEDLNKVLQRYEQVLDVRPDDLNLLLRQTELEAFRRRMGAVTCADILSSDVITASPGTTLRDAWERMHEHRIKALPVVDPEQRVIGIITQVDFLEYAGLDRPDNLAKRLRTFMQGSRRDGRKTVGEIMSKRVETARSDEHIATLIPKLTDGGRHHIPIVDEEGILAGIITQTDLLAALYRGHPEES